MVRTRNRPGAPRWCVSAGIGIGIGPTARVALVPWLIPVKGMSNPGHRVVAGGLVANDIDDGQAAGARPGAGQTAFGSSPRFTRQIWASLALSGLVKNASPCCCWMLTGF